MDINDCKKAYKDYNSSSIELIEKLFDRVYGKPKQVMDIEPHHKGRANNRHDS